MLNQACYKLNYFLLVNLIGLGLTSGLATANVKELNKDANSIIDISYLNPRNNLDGYILDTDDRVKIDFFNATELSKEYKVDGQGEIYLPKVGKCYVRGLTIIDLENLLKERFNDFLVDSELSIRIIAFRPINILVRGEIRNPGNYKLSPYEKETEEYQADTILQSSPMNSSKNYNYQGISPFYNTDRSEIKSGNIFATSLSDAIFKAGGITSYSNISKIKVIRNIPISQGGGKKQTTIDLNPYMRGDITEANIRLYDKDSIFIPKSEDKDPNLLPNAVLSGLSPKFITVEIAGQIERPGRIKIPLEGTLADLINVSGPPKTLSGDIELLRYKQDGTIIRKKFRFSRKAKPGSDKNPYLVAGDIVTVGNSLMGRSAGIIKTVTEPFLGLYTAKELIDGFSE